MWFVNHKTIKVARISLETHTTKKKNDYWLRTIVWLLRTHFTGRIKPPTGHKLSGLWNNEDDIPRTHPHAPPPPRPTYISSYSLLRKLNVGLNKYRRNRDTAHRNETLKICKTIVYRLFNVFALQKQLWRLHNFGPNKKTFTQCDYRFRCLMTTYQNAFTMKLREAQIRGGVLATLQFRTFCLW
jgi:hypothetical protein